MGCGRGGHRNGEFEDMSRNRGNGCHGGFNALVGLIFGIVSFSITLAFKIVEVVFQALFGVLSGIGSSSRNSQKAKNIDEKIEYEKNVREFKKSGSSKGQPGAAKEEIKHNSAEAHNKDFYIFLFILAIIPTVVALAMGKLLYAGIIGAAGFGIMLIAGVITAIAGSFRKKAAEKKVEEVKEEPKEDAPVEKLIKEAFEKLFVIRKDIDKISDAEVRAKLEAICSTGEKIIGEVRTNPEGLTHVRKFFYYYLDAFGEIVKKYLRLSNFEESSEEVGKLVAEAEKSFADIDGIFKDLCKKLLEEDMMNLKAEINVIKNSN